jgi:hypothetical protein
MLHARAAVSVKKRIRLPSALRGILRACRYQQLHLALRSSANSARIHDKSRTKVTEHIGTITKPVHLALRPPRLQLRNDIS